MVLGVNERIVGFVDNSDFGSWVAARGSMGRIDASRKDDHRDRAG